MRFSKGFYYSYHEGVGFDFIGPVPLPPTSSLGPNLQEPPNFEFPNPPNGTIPALVHWHYSEASLDGVIRVRKSKRGGIELEYVTHAIALGNFNLSEALDWILHPQWLTVVGSECGHSIEFSTVKPESSVTTKRMKGRIAIWFYHDKNVIQLE